MTRYLIGALFGASLILSLQASYSPPMPKLIGHECEGSGGDLWAMDESDFPRCDMIEENR
jgi:hypothetical protein